MKRAMLACFLLGATAFAAEPTVIPLWPGVAPGSEGWSQTEEPLPSERGSTPNLRNVTHPTLTVYLPEPGKARGTAMVVCPGGGFTDLVMAKEGTTVAHWLNSLGIAAFVLKYRVARTGDEEAKDPVKMQARRQAVIPLAIADAQQAIRVVRGHASDWGIARDRIGIMGFSAGGYLANAVALQHDAESRPDFAAPIYGGAPPNVNVPKDAPPIFLVLANDDEKVEPVNNSVRIYSAWRQAGISAELHVYARGGHGFALRRNGLPVNSWTDRFRDWLGDLDRARAVAPSKPAAGPAER